MPVRAFAVVLLALAGSACSAPERIAQPTPPDSLRLAWQPVDSLNRLLPDGVRLYAAADTALPLRAWYVQIDEADPAIDTDVVLARDTTDLRATASDFAADYGACVAVNGGYFRMDAVPAEHVGLLLVDGLVVDSATTQVVRDGEVYPTARAALGLLGEAAAIAWVHADGPVLYTLEAPFPNRPGAPAAAPPSGRSPWLVGDALSAGPMLLRDGALRVTADEEVFFGTSIPATHPRTAAGVTADGALILMVVDGRQPESRGVDLVELAYLMRQAGAINALNLDGGGSSALVVQGRLVNRPTGGTFQREVMSALVTRCE